jgi:hypothetical protein
LLTDFIDTVPFPFLGGIFFNARRRRNPNEAAYFSDVEMVHVGLGPRGGIALMFKIPGSRKIFVFVS